MTWTKLAALKNGQGGARRNKDCRQVDMPRPNLQGNLLESGEYKTTTQKGDDAHDGKKPS